MTARGGDQPDAELVSRIRRGERELFAFLVRRHQERLYRYALGMVRDSDAAADLVQDSFIKAYTDLSSCRNPSRFDGWVFRILRNRCMDYVRDVRRKSVSFEEKLAQTSGSGDPAGELERGEMERTLEEALGALPEAQREAFLLKHVEELSYEEMSGMLGVGTSALKMRVMRAREALRAILGRQESQSAAQM